MFSSMMGWRNGRAFQCTCGCTCAVRAGQAVVQIAEDRHVRQQFALKFFLTRQAFEQEARLYEDPDQPSASSCRRCHAS